MTIPSDAEILELLNRLDRVSADALESGWLDFKPWHGPKEDMKLVNGQGDIVVFGVADGVVGRGKAILAAPSSPDVPIDELVFDL